MSSFVKQKLEAGVEHGGGSGGGLGKGQDDSEGAQLTESWCMLYN